ncbi:MAG: LacI family DNA-binding transcriptional regulator [Anaerolineae bacterium]|nr:LacI family DNA-binding transcriptional regulator [Anaerolineae bacterium]
MASIKDVAKQAGVSVATVSRVFSNEPHVRSEVRNLVLQVADELGYRPNRIASSLRKRSSKVIGLLVPDIRNSVFVDIARAIEDVANSQNMSIFLCNTDEDPAKEQMYLETLLDELVAGIILAPTQETREPFEFLLKSGTPIVSVDRRINGAAIDCVLSDNVQAAELLTNQLIGNGYTHIGAVLGLENSTTGRERLKGFERALRKHNIEIDPDFVKFIHPDEADSEVIVSRWLRSENCPNALLTGNSRITLGAINAITQAKLSVPNDIALAGFDDTPWMPFVGSGVTVISQPTYDIGRTAAELLFQRMAEAARPVREVVLKSKLIERGSIRTLRP